MSPEQLQERLRKVKALVLDVDGVLTRGEIIWTDTGTVIKRFNVRDGSAIKYAQRCGILVALITGKYSEANSFRARELGITEVFQRALDKRLPLWEILRKYSLHPDEVCYVGDDLPDIPVLRQVGVAVAVGDAAAEVKQIAHYVTETRGGEGAVREVIELILKAQGKWDRLIQDYMSRPPEPE
jgi:3-deoxy-D-manno-octulosonate 8-phosphate phosphatase (KDO 8-P phosphatase)